LGSNPNRDIKEQVCLYFFIVCVDNVDNVDNSRVISRSHVQEAPSYVSFRRFGVADNGRPYSSRISSAIAQSITMLSATLSDLLVSLNRLMSGRFEGFACAERMPSFELQSIVACCQLETASVCSPGGDGEHLTGLAFFIS
jgi:hypothetical protein